MAQGANRVAMIWATASELVALAGGLIMRTDSCSRPGLFWNRTLGNCQNSQIRPTPPNYVS